MVSYHIAELFTEEEMFNAIHIYNKITHDMEQQGKPAIRISMKIVAELEKQITKPAVKRINKHTQHQNDPKHLAHLIYSSILRVE